MVRGTVRLSLALAVSVVLAVLPASPAAAAITTQDLTQGVTPTDLANALVGAGVTVSNVTYTGAPVAAGRFSGGGSAVGFESGIILSSGNIANVVGPNTSDAITTQNNTAGDPNLAALTGRTSLDAAVLEFDFVPNASTIQFQYVFSSDEYNEYVNTEFDDVFAFFVNGVNCATIGGQRVSINTINGGNPFGTEATNPHLYRNNDPSDGGGGIDTEMDGLTVVLTCTAPVNPNVTNHMKLAISDSGDRRLDSNVFIQAGSLTTVVPRVSVAICSDQSVTPQNAPAGYNVITGTANSETLTGTAGNDVIFGLGGQDDILGLGGDDILFGGDGNDRLTGGEGNDILCGGPGHDQLNGEGGNDGLSGDPGNDQVNGGAGDDQLLGGPGYDRLDGGTGTNTNDGGPDSDNCLNGTNTACFP